MRTFSSILSPPPAYFCFTPSPLELFGWEFDSPPRRVETVDSAPVARLVAQRQTRISGIPVSEEENNGLGKNSCKNLFMTVIFSLLGLAVCVIFFLILVLLLPVLHPQGDRARSEHFLGG